MFSVKLQDREYLVTCMPNLRCGDVVSRVPIVIKRCRVEVLGDDLLTARESVTATHFRGYCILGLGTMSRLCAFCPNPANTLEHLWPDWILKSLSASQPIRHSIGRRPAFYVNNPAVKVRAVCEQCNGGWMSDLEALNRPVIGALIHDISFPLDEAQQASLAAWTLKTGMVLDAINRRDRVPFYSAIERSLLRTQSSMPSGTAVWFARFSGSGFHAGGIDIWLDQGEILKAAQGWVTTLIVGHLAIQSVTIRGLHPDYVAHPIETVAIKAGPWAQLLHKICPPSGKVNWPPQLTFTSRGQLSIGALIDRWRSGRKA
jgi:hypothetical protein